MADENQHEIWAAIASRVKRMGHLAPEVMPQAALDLASLVIAYAVALGCDPRAVLRAVAPAVLRAVEPDLQKRCPTCAWAVGEKGDNRWWCHSCECEWETAAVTPQDPEQTEANDPGRGQSLADAIAGAKAQGFTGSDEDGGEEVPF